MSTIVPVQDSYYRSVDQLDYEGLQEDIEKALRNGNRRIYIKHIRDDESVSMILRLIKGNYHLSKQVKAIEFEGCRISDEQMQELAGMTNIFEVIIAGGSLSSTGIHLLTTMNLVSLGIGEIELNKRVSELASSRIKKLLLTSCELEDGGIKSLAKGRFEEIIICREGKVTLEGIRTLAVSTTVTALSLIGIMENWKPSEKLKLGETLARDMMLIRLSVRDNNLDFRVAAALAKSKTLQYLVFSKNREGRREDRAIAFKALADNEDLQSLIMEECDISDEDLIALSHNQALTSLTIEETNESREHFSEQGIKALANLSTLTELDLGSVYISSEFIFNKFVQLRSLQFCGLFKRSSADKMSRKIAQNLATLPNLTSLTLWDNESDLEAFFNTTTLTTLSYEDHVFDNDYSESAREIMKGRIAVNRRVVHNWQRVCFLLAFHRANRTNLIRDTALSIVSDVMSFLEYENDTILPPFEFFRGKSPCVIL